MSANVVLEDLAPGSYSVGVKGYFNEAGDADADFSMHVYSSNSPVHFFEGSSIISEQTSGDYVAPAALAVCVDGSGQDDYGDGCAEYNENTHWCGNYNTAVFQSE